MVNKIIYLFLAIAILSGCSTPLKFQHRKGNMDVTAYHKAIAQCRALTNLQNFKFGPYKREYFVMCMSGEGYQQVEE